MDTINGLNLHEIIGVLKAALDFEERQKPPECMWIIPEDWEKNKRNPDSRLEMEGIGFHVCICKAENIPYDGGATYVTSFKVENPKSLLNIKQQALRAVENGLFERWSNAKRTKEILKEESQ